jgi:hypothetical protein
LRSRCLLILFTSLVLSRDAAAAVQVELSPSTSTVEPGQTFDLEIQVVNESDLFNGYGAAVTYDPGVLTFVQQSPLSLQEGPLMTDACSLRFHDFQLAPDSTHVEIGHVLLCAGVSVSGPGTVYRLRFTAKHVQTTTSVQFETTPQFYDQGLFVGPVTSSDATVTIGTGTGVDVPTEVPRPLVAYPNPFNPRTQLSFVMPRAGSLELTIYTAAGRRVRTLARGVVPAGPVTWSWDGRDDRGRALASGVFHARLTLGHASHCIPLTLLR